jgi:site-specific DNA-methyltransferase (adenine-specific)
MSSQDKNFFANKIQQEIEKNLQTNGIAILPPMDVEDSLSLLHSFKFTASCTILDPWYNKGTGGNCPIVEYDTFIERILTASSLISSHIFLWGFPEIIGAYVRKAPEGFKIAAWLTWYYKNCPSVIRGWRSSQNACIHYTSSTAKMHPENFLNEEQLMRYKSGNMRFVPGPSSVIEEPLIIGFVGKKERTGHPSQKPEKVFERLIQMATTDREIVFDPMAGSGTTAAVAQKINRKAIVCDASEEYIKIIEKRTGVERIKI